MSINVTSVAIGSAAIGLVAIGFALLNRSSDSPSYLSHEPQVEQDPYPDFNEWENRMTQGPSQGHSNASLQPSQGGTRRKVKRSKRNKKKML